jgi:hypothetical protein
MLVPSVCEQPLTEPGCGCGYGVGRVHGSGSKDGG